MITMSANSIEIPQGETASIQLAFKDQNLNTPLILTGRENMQHSIIVTIKDGVVSNTSNDLIAPKEYEIKIDEEEDRDSWHIFNSTEVIDINLSKVDDTLPSDAEEHILYKCRFGDGNAIDYRYKDGGNEYSYGFSNSSVHIDFHRNDTLNASAKTYYLEISHIIKPNDGDILKETLLKPLAFVVKGALL